MEGLPVGPSDEASRSARLRIAMPRVAARDYGIVIAFVMLFVLLSLASDAFLTKSNILSMLDQTAPIGIMAVGSTLVFIAGGFDLSIGSIFAIAGVVAAKLVDPAGVTVALFAGALVGVGFGALNGMLVTLGRINPFIATLGSQIVIRGFALVLTGGLLFTISEPSFSTFGQGRLLGITYGIWVWILFAAIGGFILSRTTLGRYIYATGGNPEAARLSGVRVPWIKALTFTISGFSASLAGVLIASRVATGQADAGNGIELTVIAGIVIGGISIFGGEGAIWRAVLGVLMLTMISNGFNLLSIDALYSQMFQGGIILLAVGIDSWSRRRA